MCNKEKFEEILRWYVSEINSRPDLLFNNSLHEAMGVLHRCLEWEICDLDACIKFEASLRTYVTNAGPMSDTTQPFFDLQRKMDEHTMLFNSVVSEQIDLLSRIQSEMRKKPLTVTEVPQLLAVRNRIEELTEIQGIRLGKNAGDRRFDNRLSTMQNMVEENALYRKVLESEVNNAGFVTTTIRSRRNIIVAEFPRVVLYIDVGGKKSYCNDAALIAGRCYKELIPTFNKDTADTLTVGDVRNMSVAFHHAGGGEGKMVFVEEATPETIKSFEDTLYNRKGD